MEFVAAVIGVVLVVEGLPWLISPRGVKSLLRQIVTMSDQVLRRFGFAFVLLGLFLLFFVGG